MRTPTPLQLLQVWESGSSPSPAARGLLLLGSACDEYPPEALAALPLGRRDALLLQLRARLFGREMCAVAHCPQCVTPIEATFRCDDLLFGIARQRRPVAGTCVFRPWRAAAFSAPRQQRPDGTGAVRGRRRGAQAAAGTLRARGPGCERPGQPAAVAAGRYRAGDGASRSPGRPAAGLPVSGLRPSLAADVRYRALPVAGIAGVGAAHRCATWTPWRARITGPKRTSWALTPRRRQAYLELCAP